MIGEHYAAQATRPSWRERQRLARERLILDEAEQLLNEEGYEGLVMDRLAERVGVSKGTLYQHFPKKEDLFGAILLHGLERLDEQLTGHLADSARPAAERLGQVLAVLIERHTAWMATVTTPQRNALAAALADHPGRRAAFAQFFAGLCALIQQGQECGEFDRAIPADVAARFLLSLAGARSGIALCDDATVSGKEFAALTIRFCLQGLAAHSSSESRAATSA